MAKYHITTSYYAGTCKLEAKIVCYAKIHSVGDLCELFLRQSRKLGLRTDLYGVKKGKCPRGGRGAEVCTAQANSSRGLNGIFLRLGSKSSVGFSRRGLFGAGFQLS